METSLLDTHVINPIGPGCSWNPMEDDIRGALFLKNVFQKKNLFTYPKTSSSYIHWMVPPEPSVFCLEPINYENPFSPKAPYPVPACTSLYRTVPSCTSPFSFRTFIYLQLFSFYAPMIPIIIQCSSLIISLLVLWPPL